MAAPLRAGHSRMDCRGGRGVPEFRIVASVARWEGLRQCNVGHRCSGAGMGRKISSATPRDDARAAFYATMSRLQADFSNAAADVKARKAH